MDLSRVRVYDWTVDASGLILSGVGLRECTVELFEAVRVDRVECLDTQSRPPRLLLVCHGCAFGREWLVVCLRQCTVELTLQKQETGRRFLFEKAENALKTRLLSETRPFGDGNATDLHKADAVFWVHLC